PGGLQEERRSNLTAGAITGYWLTIQLEGQAVIDRACDPSASDRRHREATRLEIGPATEFRCPDRTTISLLHHHDRSTGSLCSAHPPCRSRRKIHVQIPAPCRADGFRCHPIPRQTNAQKWKKTVANQRPRRKCAHESRSLTE